MRADGEIGENFLPAKISVYTVYTIMQVDERTIHNIYVLLYQICLFCVRFVSCLYVLDQIVCS